MWSSDSMAQPLDPLSPVLPPRPPLRHRVPGQGRRRSDDTDDHGDEDIRDDVRNYDRDDVRNYDRDGNREDRHEGDDPLIDDYA